MVGDKVRSHSTPQRRELRSRENHRPASRGSHSTAGEKDVFNCSPQVPRLERPPVQKPGDSAFPLDFEGPVCAGVQRDLFPSTTVYVIATFVEPSAKHYDPVKKAYVVGPLTSKV